MHRDTRSHSVRDICSLKYAKTILSPGLPWEDRWSSITVNWPLLDTLLMHVSVAHEWVTVFIFSCVACGAVLLSLVTNTMKNSDFLPTFTAFLVSEYLLSLHSIFVVFFFLHFLLLMVDYFPHVYCILFISSTVHVFSHRFMHFHIHSLISRPSPAPVCGLTFLYAVNRNPGEK